MFVDIQSRFRSLSKEVVNIYRIMNYSYMVNTAVKESITINSIKIIPRVNATRKELIERFNEFKIMRKYRLIALVVNDVEDLKSYVKFKNILDLVYLSRDALLKLGKKGREKLIRLNLPVELCFKDIINLLGINRFLKGLEGVIKDYIEGKVDIVISSGADKPYEIIHPLIMESLLNNLGIPEDLSRKSIKDLPLKLLSRFNRGCR